MSSQHTFPLASEGEGPVNYNVDFRGTVSYCYANLLQTALQGSLACWKSSGH